MMSFKCLPPRSWHNINEAGMIIVMRFFSTSVPTQVDSPTYIISVPALVLDVLAIVPSKDCSILGAEVEPITYTR